jgi:quinoprotein glucose dehydrogenase
MARLSLVCLFLIGLAGVAALPAADNPAKPYKAYVAAASDEGLRAMKRIRVPEGLRIDLFAAEPLLANPVAFCVDHKNRFYVAETFRLHDGVTDIRGHMNWLDDDLACRTVTDRVAMLKRRVANNAASYGVHHDRVRLIEDTKGTGKADRATVFADGFHSIESGIGAGLLARGGDVWYTCIPGLWRLRDTKGSGTADERTLLHDGFGVHVGYLGHDLHGLRFGPDGRLYFSVGDRGLNVPLKGGRSLFYPDTGCVLRCNPDGSDLEVLATGLRNPQELAFDQYGNLFTGDNNSDAGDKARWVYVVEGGDSGWRIGYQFGTVMGPRGPFMAEDLWKPQWEGQAAYIVPPIANVADGPSGLTYYPGLGLPGRYDGHFFLADFRGGSGQSGVRSFAVELSGASFKLVDQHQFIWSVLATDVDFGTDCAVYLTDWVEGWGKPNKGRIYKVSDPQSANDPAVKEVKHLLADGMAGRTEAELVRLLGHKDMRVRQEAQFALAAKGSAAVPALTQVAREGKELLPRLHAVWGLGQVARKDGAAYRPLLALLGDGAAEVRAQAAKVLGHGKVTEARGKLTALLADAEPRVRFFAAQALAHVGGKESVAPVLAMLRDNADRDTYLRHAGVMALVGAKDTAALLAAADDASPAVRRAVLLALRRLHSPEVARFLGDTEPSLVLEAARAVYDLPIEAALPQLAALVKNPKLPDALGYRVLNANFRLGKAENAAAVARFAASPEASEKLRVEALKELADWAKPAGRDRVMGLWRPLPPRSADVAAALRPALGGVFSGPDKVRQEAARLAARLGIKEVGPLLRAMAADVKLPARGRVEALRGLAALKDARLTEATELALKDSEPRVRNEGRRLLAQRRPEDALAALEKALRSGPSVERQGAFAVLAEIKGPGAAELLARWLDRLLNGEVEPAVRLDLVEAAGRRSEPAVKEKLARYEAAAQGGPAARYRDALVGGDAEAGRRIFFEKAEVSCLRCHKVGGVGGEVGPDLSDVGKRQPRDYLLESIVEPSKQIAKGFETLVLTLTNGKSVVGVLKSEDAKEVKLMTAEGKLVVVPKDQIEERQAGKSAMPEDVTKYLSRSDVRDLVEFLAGLKEAPKH